jgi:hypothetical protein
MSFNVRPIQQSCWNKLKMIYVTFLLLAFLQSSDAFFGFQPSFEVNNGTGTGNGSGNGTEKDFVQIPTLKDDKTEEESEAAAIVEELLPKPKAAKDEGELLSQPRTRKSRKTEKGENKDEK